MNRYLWKTVNGHKGQVIAKDLTEAIAMAKTVVHSMVKRNLASERDLQSVVCSYLAKTCRKTDQMSHTVNSDPSHPSD